LPGARIVRNVTSSRSRSVTSSSSTASTPVRELENGHALPTNSLGTGTTRQVVNGLHFDLSASAPELAGGLLTTTKAAAAAAKSATGQNSVDAGGEGSGSGSSPSKTKHTSKSSSSSRQHQQKHEEVQRIHSPQPHHPPPPNGTPNIVGLKA
jgi:hypothetical protein